MVSSRKSANIRVGFSLILCVLIVFEMLYDVTGDFVHEFLSIAFAIIFIIHTILARKWVAAAFRASLHKKTRKMKNVARLIVMLVILIDVLVLVVTSISLSKLMGNAGVVLSLPGFDRFILRIVHTISAYVLCAATLVHVALHYLAMVKVLHIPYDPSRRKILDAIVAGVAAIGIVALGISCYSNVSQRERGAGGTEGKGQGKSLGEGNGKNQKNTPKDAPKGNGTGGAQGEAGGENDNGMPNAGDVENEKGKGKHQGKGRQDGSGDGKGKAVKQSSQ